ncbi:MAG: hypothetical protein ACO3A2_09310 [Bdellovibrionia bacterium]
MKKVILSTLLFLGWFGTGCGQILPANIQYAPASSAISGFVLNSDPLWSRFTCPNIPNVRPKMDTNLPANANSFTVCTSKNPDNLTDYWIQGTLSQGNTLCAIPSEMNDDGVFAPLRNSSGNVMYKCSAGSSSGYVLNIPGITSFNTNAMIIVPYTYLGRLITCMNYPENECPNFSVGRIR